MNEIKATKKLTQSGGSLVINVTKEAQALDLERGDYVEVSLKSNTVKYDFWGIFDMDGNLDVDPEPMVFKTRAEAMEVLNSDAYEYPDDYFIAPIVKGTYWYAKYCKDV